MKRTSTVEAADAIRRQVCGGLREVIRVHAHVLSYGKMIALGFTSVPAGYVGGRKD